MAVLGSLIFVGLVACRGLQIDTVTILKKYHKVGTTIQTLVEDILWLCVFLRYAFG